MANQSWPANWPLPLPTLIRQFREVSSPIWSTKPNVISPMLDKLFDIRPQRLMTTKKHPGRRKCNTVCVCGWIHQWTVELGDKRSVEQLTLEGLHLRKLKPGINTRDEFRRIDITLKTNLAEKEKELSFRSTKPSSPKAEKRLCFGQNFCAVGHFLENL